jgi:hypothetical protein
MDGYDVPVLQPRDRPRFPMEPLAGRGIGLEVDEHQLDCDIALQQRIVRAIEHTHPAAADALDYLIASNRLGMSQHRFDPTGIPRSLQRAAERS